MLRDRISPPTPLTPSPLICPFLLTPPPSFLTQASSLEQVAEAKTLNYTHIVPPGSPASSGAQPEAGGRSKDINPPPHTYLPCSPAPAPLPPQVTSLKRQVAESSSADAGDLQRRLKEVTDLLYLKQVCQLYVCVTWNILSK